MSSSPPAERARWSSARWSPAGWSLRGRLLAMLILLLAAVCLVIGAVTEAALHRYLVGQTDSRLEGVRDRLVQRGGGERLHQRPHLQLEALLNAPGLGPGTLGARVVDGVVVTAGRVPERGPIELVEPYPELAEVPVDGRPHTLDLGTAGPYRLLATRTDRGDVLVTGLSLADAHATVDKLVLTEAGIGLAALLAAGLGGSAVIRLALRPLRRVAATAGRVAELPLHAGEVVVAERVPAVDTDPRTEVGQVGAALNRLLGHVDAALVARQASETRLRQFVADASHELRTPLAAIRGYAELGRTAAVGASPEVVQVLDRVQTQTARMTTLVEDLLLLARLDAGRPLESAPVDLTALVVDSVTDAHVAGPGHLWRLDLPDEPVAVQGDPARLHQVVANLLANAATHTPAGTRVTVGLSAAADRVDLAVTDDGPGIPESLRPHVFQRFARGDSSRSRAAGSTGLGLSIVAAVVGAHGGGVSVSSRPGCTTFRVSLPRSGAALRDSQRAGR